MRIVSLIASATEMVHALGLGEFQVGRSHECDYPASAAALPVCTKPKFDVSGDSREIDRRVRETLKSAFSVYDVFEDILRLACACGVEERGNALVDSMKERMSAIAARAKSTGRHPRVAAVEWPEPLMAAGNWVPELIALLGAENLFGEPGAHSPWMNWEDLIAADPDAIISMPCGYDLERARREMHWLSGRPGWDGLRAVREGRVFVADGNQYFNRPGPRVVESLRMLAEMLFPEAFEARHEGVGWARQRSVAAFR